MPLLMEVNPRRRKSRRKLSAKQIAAGFGGKRGRKRRSASGRKRTHRRVRRTFATNPAPKIARRARRAIRSIRRRFRRNPSALARMGGGKLSMSGAVGMLKSAAIGGGGAIAVDIVMGFASKVLPPQIGTPIDADGKPNYPYFATKAGLAILLGTLGKKLPLIGPHAARMAEGALTVQAYNFMRPLVPQQIFTLGKLGAYFNPAPTMPRMGAYANVRGLNGEFRAQNQRPGDNRVAGLRRVAGVRAYEGANNGGSRALSVLRGGR